MRRWALVIGTGIVALSNGMAQPPAESERFPVAPSLPGVVVSKSQGERPSASTYQMPVRRVNYQSEPVAVPSSAEPTPFTKYVTATISPVVPPTVPSPVIGMPLGQCDADIGVKDGKCKTGKCEGGVGSHSFGILDWLGYQSKAKGNCTPTPYHQPVQAWFGCDHPKGHLAPGCGTQGGCTTSGGTVVVHPGAVSGKVTEVPGTVIKVPAPSKGTSTFAEAVPDTDPIPSFRKVNDGLGFTPGSGAPTAAPTIKVSKPK